MTETEELRFLKEIAKFEVESLRTLPPESNSEFCLSEVFCSDALTSGRTAGDSREDESFNYFVTTAYPPRVYNDVFIIRDAQNYMIKLSISHAIAQSVKVHPGNDLSDPRFHYLKNLWRIPETVAATGKVSMSRKKIMMSVGELFILRISKSPDIVPCQMGIDRRYQLGRIGFGFTRVDVGRTKVAANV
jgi:uncharacterized Rmd1/YagE family protein